MPTETQASRELWFEAPRCVCVREGRVPDVGPGQILARAIASGISQGTELLLYRGEGKTPFDPSLDRPGTPMYPRRYGYAWVGEVLARGEGVEGLPVGTRLFALAPHGDLHALEPRSVYEIDRRIPPHRAVLAASLETAVTSMWDSGVSLGDEVVVLGGGVIGLLVARLASSIGGHVRLVETSPRRRAVAKDIGLSAVSPDEDRPSGEADVVFEATGDPAALDRAIAHAGQEATVVVVSFYGARTAPVSLGSDFHRRRLVLRASQVSSIPPARSRRWNAARRFDLVRTLLTDPILDRLIDRPVAFASAPAAYDQLDRAPGDAVQTIFVYA